MSSQLRAKHRQYLPNVKGWAGGKVCMGLMSLIDFQDKYLASQRPGAVMEIGIHHGRTMLGMMVAAKEAGRRVVGVDMFGAGDDGQGGRNWLTSIQPQTPADGEARKQVFLSHLTTLFGSSSLDWFTLLESRSQDITHEEYCDAAGSSDSQPFSLIHLDGSHDHDDVAEDMLLTVGLLDDDGVLVLDDMVNAMWLGVAAAVWPMINELKLHPVALIDSQLVVAKNQGAAEEYRKLLRPQQRKTVPLPTGPVLVIL